MRLFRNTNPELDIKPPREFDNERRKCGRVVMIDTEADVLGKLIDLSPSGCKTQGKRTPKLQKGQHLELRLQHAYAEVRILSQIVDVQPGPKRTTIHRLKFVNPTPEQKQGIQQLLRAGWQSLTLSSC